MSTRRRHLKLAFSLIAIVILIAIFLSPDKLVRSKLPVSLDWPSNFTCNSVCFVIPRTRNRLGNHLFFFAALIYVSALTGRTPAFCFAASKQTTVLDGVFTLDVDRRTTADHRCPVHRFRHKWVYAFNPRVNSLVQVPTNQSLRLVGYFSSWKYVLPVADRLRQSLHFRPELTQFAQDFLTASVQSGWTPNSFVRVAVHVRRGDFLRHWAVRKGFTTAPPRYLRRAMGYFVERFTRVQFVVASNDIRWCRRHIRTSVWDTTKVNVTFSEGHTDGQDFALLSSCDHFILTTGTYGWWAAWFARGTTVYYADFPRSGSSLMNRSRMDEYFPPKWIGFHG